MTIPPIGQVPKRAFITAISLSTRCQITTTEPHAYSSGDQVRLTDLNSSMPILRGMDQINNKLFEIEVDGDSSFLLKYELTKEYVDSTEFTPYVLGGRCNLNNHTYIFEP